MKPFGCPEARESFAAYLDGELAAADAEILEAHLKSCASCRTEAEAMAALDRDLQRLAVAADYSHEERIRSILAAARRESSRGLEVVPSRSSSTSLRLSSSRPHRLLRPALLAAGVLAGVAVLVALFVSGYRQKLEEAEARRLRLESEIQERERRMAEEDLHRREADRRRALEEVARKEEERRWLQQRLKEIEEHERDLAEAMKLAAEDQRRRELEERFKKAQIQAEEDRKRALEDLRHREEAERQAREALAEIEKEREMAAARVQARVAAPAPADAGAKKAPPPPARAPQAVVPLDLIPWKLDPVKVDLAIGRGVEFLKGQLEPVLANKGDGRSLELVLWTLVHAGVSESDPDFQQLLKVMLESRLERTYNVALQAMLLEELHRVKYQLRIQQCAQFLVDNQCRNGQWSYGTPSLFAEDIHVGMGRDLATVAVRTPVREYVPDGPRLKPKVRTFYRLWKRREGPPSGDNSNSQYALLGLRACHDAGILLPPEVIRLSQKWWRDSQHDDPKRDPSEGQGWGYGGRNQGPAYGSMTAGAVGSLAVTAYILREDWRRDRALQKGLQWLARHFSVSENPEKENPAQWLYYYLYALERAGVLAGVEKIGIHDWYSRGVRAILESQQADGSWQGGQPVPDTCFAVLFLRRATRPLVSVETGDSKR